MVLPLMASRVEQLGQLSCEWIKPREISRLVRITSMARKCEIGLSRYTVVFVGNDVFDVMGRHRRIDFGQPAVSAAKLGAASNQPPKLVVHEAFRGFISAFRAFACKIEMKSIART